MTFFIARGREKVGPLPLSELQRMAAVGELKPSDMVLREGEPKWRKAESVERLSFDAPKVPPPPPPAKPIPQAVAMPSSAGATTPSSGPPAGQPVPPWVARLRDLVAGPDARPWNPVVLFLLGLLCGPTWLGALVAVNALRLGLPWRRPLAVALAMLLVSGLSICPGGVWLAVLEFVLGVGSLGALWWLEVRPQRAAYAAFVGGGGQAGRWREPAFAAAAWVALFVAVGVVEAIVTEPLQPREVCERFAKAWRQGTQSEMGRYATKNMGHALPTLAGHPLEGEGDLFELPPGDEAALPAEKGGGYLVGFRWFVQERGERVALLGVFHLVLRGEQWQVEEVYFQAPGKPLEQWPRLSELYPLLDRRPAGAAGHGGLLQAQKGAAQQGAVAAPVAEVVTAGAKGAVEEASKHGMAKLLPYLSGLPVGLAALWRRLRERVMAALRGGRAAPAPPD